MPNFALIGAAGYIAPRHFEAIKSVGGRLVAVCDPHDSVGILDKYDFGCRYFREFERFDRFCEKIRGTSDQIDYVSVCSPNYLHDAHIRFGLRIGANVICEKPLVINPWNLDAIKRLEEKNGNRVWSILQLRLNPELMKLRFELEGNDHQVRVDYFTPRGSWYLNSWKGDDEKSGGLLTNIGIHLLDMLIWMFGEPVNRIFGDYAYNNQKVASGSLFLKRGNVNFSLSIFDHLKPTRLLTVDGKEYEISNGFTDLHTKSYQAILTNQGFGIEDCRPAIELCYKLRQNKEKL